MNAINSYETIIKNPGTNIINWEYLILHPESKFNVWQEYQTNILFKEKVDFYISTNEYFKCMFNKHFSSFINEKLKLKRK